MSKGILRNVLLFTIAGGVMLQVVEGASVEYLPAATERTGGTLPVVDTKGYKDSGEIISGLLRGPLTMERAVRIALLNNRNLRASLEEIGVAKAVWVEAATLPNPSLSVGLEYPMLSTMANRYIGQVTQNFISLVMRALKKNMAVENLEATKAKVA